MAIKCRCGKETKGGKVFCGMDCQKAYLSKGFSQNRERKEWMEKNGPVFDSKKWR